MKQMKKQMINHSHRLNKNCEPKKIWAKGNKIEVNVKTNKI